MSTGDTRIIEMIALLHAGRLDDACDLMEAFNDEVGPRPVWCHNDHRQTVADAEKHQAERGIPA